MVAVFLVLPSPFWLQTGNLFFGGKPYLYNVAFAKFFFIQAAYPVFGKPAPYAHYQLSRAYFIQGKLNPAVEEAKSELTTYPKNVRAYYILGLTLGYLNREQEAIDAFSAFIDTAPMSWAARNDKAWLQFRIGDIDGGLATIEPILDHSKDNPWIQNTYGTLLMNKNRYTEAKEAFLNAKRIADVYAPSNWAVSYPGNDPRINTQGLQAFRKSIDNNLQLVEEKMHAVHNAHY